MFQIYHKIKQNLISYMIFNLNKIIFEKNFNNKNNSNNKFNKKI